LSRVAALLIGYGNPLRQDDGLGWEVARQVEAQFEPEQVEVLSCHQLTPELAETISRAEVVVFVDARAGAEAAAGRVDCQSLVAESDAAPAFSHHVSPVLLLGLAHALYGADPAAWLLSVDGESFGYGSELSPKVRAVLPEVLARVRVLVEGALAPARG
jgi:hydrogenase maturation protease